MVSRALALVGVGVVLALLGGALGSTGFVLSVVSPCATAVESATGPCHEPWDELALGGFGGLLVGVFLTAYGLLVRRLRR